MSLLKMKLVKPEDSLESRPIMGVIYGAPGLGKTTLSFTFPKALLIDTDRGIGRAEQTYRCTSVKMDSYKDYNAIVEDIRTGAFGEFVEDAGLKTVIIDTGGTLLDDYIAESLIHENAKNGRPQGGLSLQGWGALSIKFGWLKNQFLSLGLNLIVICHQKEGEEGFVRPSVKGNTLNILYQYSDIIGYVTVEGDYKYLDFRPSQLIIGKNTGNIGKVKIPRADDPAFMNFGQMIINKVHSNINMHTKARQELKELMEKDKELIAANDSLEKLLLFAETIDDYEGIRRQFFESEIVDRVCERLAEKINEFSKVTQYTKLSKELSAYHVSLIRPAKKTLLNVAKEKGYVYDKEKAKFVKETQVKENEEVAAN